MTDVIMFLQSVCFDLSVSTEWNVLDPKIASWLLNPDNPAVTFKDILRKYPEILHVSIYVCTHVYDVYDKYLSVFTIFNSVLSTYSVCAYLQNHCQKVFQDLVA